MVRLLNGIAAAAVLFVMAGCTPTTHKVALQSGDILFFEYASGDLSQAIDAVTQTDKATNYSHMGLVEIVGTDTFLIHASVQRGVVRDTLVSFLNYDRPAATDIYRIKDISPQVIAEALKKANTWVGLPYNATFILNDTSFYCSQLIYEVYKATYVFEVAPMTFKNPDTNGFNEGWVRYFEALGIEIPEGLPGCNPNGMACSSNLFRVGSLR